MAAMQSAAWQPPTMPLDLQPPPPVPSAEHLHSTGTSRQKPFLGVLNENAFINNKMIWFYSRAPKELQISPCNCNE